MMLHVVNGESLEAAFDRRMTALDREMDAAFEEERRWSCHMILCALLAVLLIGPALILYASDAPEYQWLIPSKLAFLIAIAGFYFDHQSNRARKRYQRAFDEMRAILLWAGRKGLA